jgi:hypothetical protein
MSTHDPLCGYYTVPNAGPRPCPRCDLIDRVRADERERAVQRVEALPLPHLEPDIDEIIAAIKNG